MFTVNAAVGVWLQWKVIFPACVTLSAWMIASLAVCADLGAAALPSAAGSIAELTGIRTAYLTMSVAPFLCAAVLFVMHRMNKKKRVGKLY